MKNTLEVENGILLGNTTYFSRAYDEEWESKKSREKEQQEHEQQEPEHVCIACGNTVSEVEYYCFSIKNGECLCEQCSYESDE